MQIDISHLVLQGMYCERAVLEGRAERETHSASPRGRTNSSTMTRENDALENCVTNMETYLAMEDIMRGDQTRVSSFTTFFTAFFNHSGTAYPFGAWQRASNLTKPDYSSKQV